MIDSQFKQIIFQFAIIYIIWSLVWQRHAIDTIDAIDANRLNEIRAQTDRRYRSSLLMACVSYTVFAVLYCLVMPRVHIRDSNEK